MSQNLTISATGLKLIKAFEGYRPVDRELITGQRVVGYGHRLYSEDAVIMDKGEAEMVLLADLEPFEDMINSEVHAPMTQSQFDALCSFAFNIGPKAFLQSDTLRAINNGRPLDAANGLDIWRKSEIDGKTYVVDALMRRRTAEKALFLRTERSVAAGRENLPPVQDKMLADLSTEDALPIFTANDANGIVATAPYAAVDRPSRRREDGPAGALQLSELDIIASKEDGEGFSEAEDNLETLPETQMEAFEESAEAGLGLDLDLDLDLDLGMEDSGSLEETDILDDVDVIDAHDIDIDVDVAPKIETRKSPIAAAATDIVARLDALIDNADARFGGSEEDNFVELDDDMAAVQTDAQSNVTELKPKNNKPVAVIDELAQDDAVRMRTDSAAKYIKTTQPMNLEGEPEKKSELGLWIPIILGFILAGLAGGSMMSSSEHLLGPWGPIIVLTSFVIGLGLIIAGIYAALRMNLSR